MPAVCLLFYDHASIMPVVERPFSGISAIGHSGACLPSKGHASGTLAVMGALEVGGPQAAATRASPAQSSVAAAAKPAAARAAAAAAALAAAAPAAAAPATAEAVPVAAAAAVPAVAFVAPVVAARVAVGPAAAAAAAATAVAAELGLEEREVRLHPRLGGAADHEDFGARRKTVPRSSGNGIIKQIVKLEADEDSRGDDG
eukprot:1156524-Pelagomonas_calceolata.AAC.6